MKKALALVALAGASSAFGAVTIVPGTGTYSSIVGMPGTTAIAGVSDDSEHNITSTVGNLSFAAGQMTIGNNGVVLFGTPGLLGIGFTNNPIPAGNGAPSGISTPYSSGLAVLWDDHFPTAGQGGNTIHWREDPGVLTIEWLNEDHFSAQGTGTVTFQLQVFSSGPVLARMFYPDMLYVDGAAVNNGSSATVGFLGGSTPDANFQYTHNTVNALPSGTVLDVIPAPGTAALLGLGGLLVGRRRR